MRRTSLALLLIAAAALVVVLPLMVHGCSCGHDFDFHLVSWMEAAAQFRAGNLHPAWAFSPAWNAGEPRFVFYPPISWTLGALLGLVLPWAAVPVVYTWLALAGAGFGMYWLARELGGEAAAVGPVFAAVVYVTNPYMVFTAYERTAYAELLAAAWIPLLLAGILRERVTVPRVAIPVALLWLTNAPAAVMGCYALGLLAAVRLVWTWRERGGAAEREADPPAARKDDKGSRDGRRTTRGAGVESGMTRGARVESGMTEGIGVARSAAAACWALAWRVAAGLALGLGLAAFYVLPAAYERRWVQIAMATISGMRIEDNFLFHRTGDGPHDEVLHTASLIAVAMLAAAGVALLIASVRRNAQNNAWAAEEAAREGAVSQAIATRGYRVLALGLLAAAIGWMLTRVSLPLWRIMPEMAFLQFSWRFTAVLAAVACGGIGMTMSGMRLKWPVMAAGALALAAALSLPAASRFRQKCDDPDSVAARTAAFAARTGTDPTDEYTPVEADNDALASADPPFWFTKDGEGKAAAGAAAAGQAPMHLAINTAKATAIVLNLRDYPAWVERVNGAVVSEKIERDDGLVAFAVPAGHSQIDVVYQMTWDRKLGDGISVASLCGLCGWIGVARRRRAAAMTERVFESRIIGS